MGVQFWKRGVFRPLLACYFEELKIDCAIDQLKPGLKSEVNGAIFFCYLKSALVENAPLGGSTTRVHFAYYTQGRAAAHKHAKYWKLKDYNVKEYYCVSEWGYIFSHAWADLFALLRRIQSVRLKFCLLNSESILARAQLALKGNERWESHWFIARYAQKTPIAH